MKYLVLISMLFVSNFSFAGADENACEPTIIYKDRIVEVEKEVYFHSETKVKVDVTRKNRFSLLLGYGASDDLKYRVLSPTAVQVQDDNDPFAGLMYQRDFGKLTLGIFGTTHRSTGGSIGINW